MMRRLLAWAALALVRWGYVGKRAQHRTTGPHGNEIVVSEGRFIGAKWEGDSILLRYVPDGTSVLHARKIEPCFISGDPLAKVWVFRD